MVTRLPNIVLWTKDVALSRRLAAALDSVVVAGFFEGFFPFARGILAILDGDLESARRQLAPAAAASLPGIVSQASAAMLAHVLFSLDDTSGAEAILDDLAVRLRDAGLHVTRAMTHLVRAHIEVARCDLAAAERWAQEALACAAERELRLAHTDALETLASIAFQKGNAATAARLLGAAEAFRERSGYRWRWPHQEEEIAALRPQLDAAHLAEGAAMSLAEAAEYGRRGWGERGRPPRGWDSLTPSESRVVDLVAAGLPNRDIAAKLFVSLATVKTHLVHVYTKLDVRTRSELAAAATRRAHERTPT